MYHKTSSGGHSFRSIVEDEDWTRPATLTRTSAVDDDGRTGYDVEGIEELELMIVDPDAASWEIEREGPDEDVLYGLIAMADLEISKDDRVEFDAGADGSGTSKYRVGKPERSEFDGDEICKYILTEDERGTLGVDDDDDGDADDDYETW